MINADWQEFSSEHIFTVKYCFKYQASKITNVSADMKELTDSCPV